MALDPTPLIEGYLGCVDELRAAVAKVPLDKLHLRPIEGRWSILEVVCHLVDSEIAWTHRMKRVLVEDKPLLIGYDESRFTAGLFYHSQDPTAELNLFSMLRTQMAKILRQVPEQAWTRHGVHNERGLIALAEMVEIEIDHVHHHLRHINEKIAAMGL